MKILPKILFVFVFETSEKRNLAFSKVVSNVLVVKLYLYVTCKTLLEQFEKSFVKLFQNIFLGKLISCNDYSILHDLLRDR